MRRMQLFEASSGAFCDARRRSMSSACLLLGRLVMFGSSASEFECFNDRDHPTFIACRGQAARRRRFGAGADGDGRGHVTARVLAVRPLSST
mmetsp:Transcript_62291/g.201986  ORF Transcript_62291/g.201986 Transcript_62291/m.201986 type:complete len:92 (-) Transcript_62291:2-277(-)